MPNTLWPHGLKHARFSCPSPAPWDYSNSCPSSRWCHVTISSYVVPFSSVFQSFPASGSFLVSQFSASGGQIFGVSASALVLPMNIQGWFPLELTGLIFLLSRGLLSVLQHHNSKASILQLSAFLMVQLSHLYITARKTIGFTIWTFVGKVMTLFLIHCLGLS